MAITKQPADDSFYPAYSQIPVETDDSTSGLEIETQNFDEDNMISLNIIDNKQSEIFDNSGGTSQNWFREFVIPRKMVPGEWYAFRVSFGTVNKSTVTVLTVALYQGTAEGHGAVKVATTDLTIGSSMTWRVQIPTTEYVQYPNTVLTIYAGKEGATAGVKVILHNMSLAYGQHFVNYDPSSVMAANSLTESVDIHRDSGFGTTKKYDLSFLAKAGFRDRNRTYPYIDPRIHLGIDYNLISAYAYRGIGEQNFNVRYASRGVRPRGFGIDFSRSNIGLVLTDRTPDSERRIYVKKYFGYPNFLTVFAKGSSALSMQSAMEVNVMYTGTTAFKTMEISPRVNIPFVLEFDEELADGADYVIVRNRDLPINSDRWHIYYVDAEVPCNPFYIRWINQKGGWDTYMFEQHKKYTQEVDRGDQYVLANSLDHYASQTRGELAPEFKNIVQAGAEQLDENDFNLLKGIALSPLVQAYNYQLTIWQRVLVNDTDLTWDTKAPRNTVSYEFQLIDEQTQW